MMKISPWGHLVTRQSFEPERAAEPARLCTHFSIGDHSMQELSVATKKDPPSKPGKPGDLPFTGERLVTTVANESMVEHLHRYGLAIDLCDGKVVLDIASGEGYGSSLLARRR